MNARAMVPLIDIVFLSLGSLLGLMAHMELIKGIDVEISRVGPGGTRTRTGDLRVVTLTSYGLTVDGTAVAASELAAAVDGGRAILRAERTLPTERALEVLAELSKVCEEVAVEVKEVSMAAHGGGQSSP